MMVNGLVQARRELAKIRHELGLALSISLLTFVARAVEVEVGDAFVRGSLESKRWEIGTGAVQLGIEARDGRLFLASFKNKLCNPPREYADAKVAWEPLSLGKLPLVERYSVKEVWSKYLPLGITVNPASD